MVKNKEMSAENRLAKNTLIYFIGNFGSKILQFLILPLLTSVLLTEEYGYYDLVITTINLTLPLVTLQLVEAIFRFMFDEDDKNKKTIVSTVTIYLIFGSVLLAVVIFLLGYFTSAIQYPFLIYLNFLSCIAFTYLQKLARSLQKSVCVAVSGVINTCVMLGVQAVTLLLFNMRVDGLLISNMIAHFVAAGYLQRKVHIEKWFSISDFKNKTLKEMLKYSLPLVPNSICWWIVAACDKYIITFFISVSANGIYSVASKFSQMLTMITNVFQMAWQESSIIESSNEDRIKFYSSTFNMYIRFLMGGFIFVLPIIRLIMPYFVAESYQIGYLYSPILLIGAVFAAFSQFYGSAYLAFKKTGGAFSTTIIAAIVNIVVGIGLVKYLGVFAPALGTAISFLVQWLLRVKQMRSYFKLSIDKKVFSILVAISGVYMVLYYGENRLIHLGMTLIGASIFAFFNRSIIKKIIKKIKEVRG